MKLFLPITTEDNRDFQVYTTQLTNTEEEAIRKCVELEFEDDEEAHETGIIDDFEYDLEVIELNYDTILQKAFDCKLHEIMQAGYTSDVAAQNILHSLLIGSSIIENPEEHEVKVKIK